MVGCAAQSVWFSKIGTDHTKGRVGPGENEDGIGRVPGTTDRMPHLDLGFRRLPQLHLCAAPLVLPLCDGGSARHRSRVGYDGGVRWDGTTDYRAVTRFS